MEQNKILDIIFKKLLFLKYDKKDIFLLLNKKNENGSFENFIYSLLLFSQKKYDDVIVRMCKSIHSYLSDLVDKYNIKPITLSNIKVNQMLSNEEILILGCKGYDSNNLFYFDIDDNLYICIDNINYIEYKNCYIIKYNFLKEQWWTSKIIQKINLLQNNKILLFKKNNEKNIFLGYFTFMKNCFYYEDDKQFNGFIITSDIHEKINENELNKYISIKWSESLLLFKNNINNLLMNKNNIEKPFNHIEDIIDIGTNHYLILDNLMQSLIINKDAERIKLINEKYNYMMKHIELSIFNLIPNISIVNEYQLILLSNCYDILYGIQIYDDYMNNVFMCLDGLLLKEDENGYISIRFIKSSKSLFLDLKLNQKIFNTVNNKTVIYIFKKIENNKFLFIGFYKVYKIISTKDPNNKLTPVFKIKKIDQKYLFEHLLYVKKLKKDNAYKNIFNDLNKKLEVYNWSKKKEGNQILTTSCISDRNDSILYKYNWVINKCLTSLEDINKFNKFSKLYIEFDNKIVNNIFKCIVYDFKFIINNKLMMPWTIAYEMTKRNFWAKELFQISFIDNYQVMQNKYDICLNIIENNNKNK